MTVTADDTDLNKDSAAATITGGTGADTLQITVSGAALIAEDFASITKIETIQAVGTTAAATFTLSDNTAGYTHASDYDTVTIDASSLTSGVATINAAAEADAKLIIKAGGADDVVTVTASANFGDSITSGAGNDTINISNGNLTSIDTIDGGAGAADVITNLNDTASLMQLSLTFRTLRS